MIASLMMYNRPEIAPAVARYWTLLRRELAARGIDAPEYLSNDAPEFDVWTAPDLVLSQTCGLPYRLWLHDRVTLIGTPDFGAPDCPPGYYNSLIVVRKDDPRETLEDFAQARFVYNQSVSQSGFGAMWNVAQERGFWFDDTFESGAHVTSARMIAEGEADISAIDSITWRLIERYDAFSDHLKVLETTPPTPGHCYIAAPGADAGAGFDAAAAAIDALAADDRETLGLRGMLRVPTADYFAVPNPPASMITTPDAVR